MKSIQQALLLLLVAISNTALANPRVSAWKQTELNETFMRG
jgi:hypothetical protein